MMRIRWPRRNPGVALVSKEVFDAVALLERVFLKQCHKLKLVESTTMLVMTMLSEYTHDQDMTKERAAVIIELTRLYSRLVLRGDTLDEDNGIPYINVELVQVFFALFVDRNTDYVCHNVECYRSTPLSAEIVYQVNPWLLISDVRESYKGFDVLVAAIFGGKRIIDQLTDIHYAEFPHLHFKGAAITQFIRDNETRLVRHLENKMSLDDKDRLLIQLKAVVFPRRGAMTLLVRLRIFNSLRKVILDLI